MKKYNWWDDPKNKKEVDRISWWDHEKNKTVFELPISVIQSGDCFVATCNDDTKKYLGELQGVAQGDTREDAINTMFLLIRLSHEYEIECRTKYQRWVPFRRGPWGRMGGRWFAIFGIHFSFRYGKGMKGGVYLPFTKLNISISSDWASYRRYKKLNSEQNVQVSDTTGDDSSTNDDKKPQPNGNLH